MRFAVLLLAASCLLSAVSGQWLEANFEVPESLHGPFGPDLVTQAGDFVYVAGVNESVVMSIDAARGFVRRGHLTVGPDYHSLCANPVNNKVYCSAYNSRAVYVIDVAADSLIATVALAGRPLHALWSPVGNKVYVTGYAGDRVYVIDGAGDTLIASIPVVSMPRRCVLAPELNKVYVALEGSSRVGVIDAVGDSVLTSFRVSGLPWTLAWCPAENKVYVSIYSDGPTVVIDALADTVLRYLQVSSMAGMCYNPLRNTLYCFGSGNLLDCATDSVLGVTAHGDDAAYTGASGKVYVAGPGLHVYDAAADTLLKRIDLYGWRLAADTAAGRMSVVGDDAQVWLIDTYADSVAGWVQTADEPVDIAYDAGVGRAYCLDQSGCITVIDGATNAILGMVRARSRMSGCALAGTGKLYCGSEVGAPLSRRSLTAVSTEGDSVLAEIPMPLAAQRFAFNPVSRRLFCASGGSGDSLLAVVDTDADTLVNVVELFNPGAVALAADTIDNVVYCGNSALSALFVLDGATGRIRRLIDMPHLPIALVWSAAENRLYSFGGYPDSSVVVVDCGTNRVRAQLQAPDHCWWRFGSYHDRLNRVFFLGSRFVIGVDCQTDSLVYSPSPLGNPRGMACDTGLSRLYVADGSQSRVYAFDCVTLETVGAVDVDEWPVAQAWNPEWKRLYTANRGGLSVSVVRDSLSVGLSAEPATSTAQPLPTIVRGVLRTGDRIPETGYRAELLDAAGRRVMELRPGANDVRHLSPGVYFVRGEGSRVQGSEGASVRKVVIHN